jgi:O-antigen/teichoic acid export membrane protein
MTAGPDRTVDAAIEASSRFGAKRLYRDAGSMATSSVANAALGAVFWAIAASMVPPAQLGVMTAVLSVIFSTSLVVASGVGDAYTTLLPAVGPGRVRVFRRGQRFSLVVSLATGLLAAVAAMVLLPEVRGSIAVGALVAVGVVGWSASILQSYVLGSLGRARWLPAMNVIIGIGKLVLLPILAFTVKWHSVELAFVIPVIAVVLVLRPAIRRLVKSGKELPETTALTEAEALREFNRMVVRTLTSVALSLGVLTLAPFLVTAFAGPSQGALFSLSLSIVQLLDFIASSLGVSLVVHASSTPHETAAMARSILVRGTILAAVGAVLITAFAPLGLRILNAQYGSMDATGVIAVLCAGSLLRIGYVVWSAVQRSRRRMRALLALNLISASVFLAIIPGLSHGHGALGSAVALLIGQFILSAGAAVHFITTGHRGGDVSPVSASGPPRP